MARYATNDHYTYHRIFSSLRGVDFSSDPSEVTHSHFTMLENMWCDPKTEDGVATETFPGYRTFARFEGTIHGIYRHRVAGKDYLVVHAGERLYRFKEEERNLEETLARLSPLDVTVKDTQGCAFSYGEQLCLLIGEKYLLIDAQGGVRTLDEDPSLAYVPVTYYNGERHEQRNILTDSVRLVFTADGAYEDTIGEEGLVFNVFNETEKTCSVRIADAYRGTGRVEVPSTAVIGTEKYTVKAVAAHGFANMPGLCAITLPPTVTFIGASAFFGDSALTAINLPDGVTGIGVEAFFGCLSLEGIHLGKSLQTVGRDAFAYCLALKEVRFGGTEEEYESILMEGIDNLRALGLTTIYESGQLYENDAVLFRYPLYEPCTAIEGVLLGDTALDINFNTVGNAYVRYGTTQNDGLITHVEVTATKKDALIGKSLCVWATASAVRFSLPVGSAPFGKEGRAAVLGCTAVSKYDGRVFFTGNPLFPNTVFYSALDDTGVNNPFYIGCLNYFNDGTGAVPNRGFLTSGGMLAVLKADSGGEGEIFFHTPANTGESLLPRVYPTVASMPGTGLAGGTVHFADEALFMGKNGLFALTRCENENERALSPRSTAVNLKLLREKTENAQMAVFEGLLYLLCDGNVYLADPRRRTAHKGGSYEYEWYYLSGIGAFAGDRPVYRYTAYLPPRASELSLSTHPSVGEIASGEIYSATLSDGLKIYYAQNAEGRFPVDTDGERTGGVFSPANRLCATDEALYFGTPDGAIGCFNTDKRGKLLYRPLQSELYILKGNGEYIPLNASILKLLSEDMLQKRRLYRKVGALYLEAGEGSVYLDGDRAVLAKPLGERNERNRVHRYYYSFAGHAFRSFCALAMDDGDFPHFSKDTVSRTTALKLKSPEGSRIGVYLRTDRHPFRLIEYISSTTADAGDADFSAFDFHSDGFATVPLREKERGWCYKQYLFESNSLRAPFGIFSLAYSFTLKKGIKP